MNETYTFHVPGEPRGKGRPRFTRSGHAYTDRQTVEYEKLIRACLYKAHGKVPRCDKGSVFVSITALYGIPKRTSRQAREGMLFGVVSPTRKPDVDNIAKVVLDALNGVVYKDDALVNMLTVAKRYGETPGLDIGIDVFYD